MSATASPTTPEPTLAACPLAEAALLYWTITAGMRAALVRGSLTEAHRALVRLANQVANPTLPARLADRLTNEHWPSLKAEFDCLREEYLA